MQKPLTHNGVNVHSSTRRGNAVHTFAGCSGGRSQQWMPLRPNSLYSHDSMRNSTVTANAVKVDEERYPSVVSNITSTNGKKPAEKVISDFLASLRGRGQDLFFTSDRSLVEPEEVSEIWRLALGQFCDKDLISKAIDGSFTIEAAFARVPGQDKWKLVGLARTISDGVFAALIADVCVHPKYQKRGIGKKLVQRLQKSTERNGPGCLGVFAKPGEWLFFWRCGFRYNRKHTVMRYVASSPNGNSGASDN